MALELKDIEAREREIAQSMSAMQRELEDLAAARRVIQRAEGPKPPLKIPIRVQLVAKRPEGAPTTFEMVEKVLEAAEKSGKDGLTGKELVDGIKEQFWPGLKSPQILPIIYGFVKNERLHKTAGGKFKRRKVEK